jgi:hypothetical protein
MTGRGEVGDRENDVAPVGCNGLVFSLWDSETVNVDADVAVALEPVPENDRVSHAETESGRRDVA